MSISEFEILSFDGKASLLSRYGKYLDQRYTIEGSRIMIYDLFGFFVEVSYRNDQRVQYIRTSSNVFESNEPDYKELTLLHLN